MKTTKSQLSAVLFTLMWSVLGGFQAQAGDWLIKYKSGTVSQSFQSLGIQAQGLHKKGRIMSVRLPSNQNEEIQILAQILRNPDVEYIVPNATVYAFRNQVTPVANLQEQWSIAKVQAEKAWGKLGRKGSKKVTVAVIDTGVDAKHTNLNSNMVPGYDFIRNNDQPDDTTSSANPGHGTHCAGIVGANGLIDGGIVGISPEVSIMPLRFLNEKGQGDLNLAIKAIDFAIERKVDIISASWGASIARAGAKPLIEAIDRANKAGILFVAAAANNGKSNDQVEMYPANAGLDNMIVVAASGPTDNKPEWSNFGKSNVSLAAPGEGIMSTLPEGKWGKLSGTSMATPMVAGLAALIKSGDASLSAPELRSLLQASADKIQLETACDCRINAAGAADTVVDKKMFVHPYSTTLDKGESVQFKAVYGKAPFKFEVVDGQIGQIDAEGKFTATAEKGETQVKVTDADGKVASNYRILVGRPKPEDGGLGNCPIGHPILCLLICLFIPDLPFCGGEGGSVPGSGGTAPSPFPFPFPFQGPQSHPGALSVEE